MQAIVREVLETLPAPDRVILAEARLAAASGDAAGHERFARQIEALRAIEWRKPGRPAPWTGSMTVTAFNAERLKNPEATRALLDRAGATVSLLSEVDVGMARSGNRHGLQALTERTGEDCLYGVEFVELDLGDPQEIEAHAGERNATGFHGNGIVSALRLTEPCLISLEEGGRWFAGRKGAQHRLGGRIAVAARVEDAPRPLWLVATHLESKTDAEDRADQMRRLLDALDSVTAGAAAIIGGDLNTKALPAGDEARWLAEPERWEPLFEAAAAAGFDWRASNVPAATQRTGPSGDPEPPFRKLDWILTRGVAVADPRVIHALDRAGRPISDHEMLAVDVSF